MKTRVLTAVGAAAAVVGAFFAGAAVGDQPTPTPDPQPSPVAFQADLEPAQTCDELLESYRDRALGLVTEWGWGHEWNVAYRTDVMFDSASKAGEPARAQVAMEEQTASETGTNIQEIGVDEPDTVKTDGKLVVRLRGNDLEIHDASGSSVVERSSIRIPRIEAGEIMLAGDTVVVIGDDQTSPQEDRTATRRGARVVTVSIADPSAPKIESTVTYGSRVISARQHGDVVRLVLAAGLPDLDFVQPAGRKITRQRALLANRNAVKASTIEDWLPTYDTGEGSEQLLDCTEVAVPPDASDLDTVSIVGFDASAPTEPRAIGLAGSATIAYESADHLYLADSPTAWGCEMCDMVEPTTRRAQADGTTHLYDFELAGIDASHVASGEVEGTIADRWSLDEADDVLRVAVGPSSETEDVNAVVTLDRQGDELVEIGRVGDLGRNEEIKGVRWFDDLAVVVTYREVDPLFTIDLADPARPRLIGELKIPGFSDYLHPVGDDQMLGIGSGGGGRAWGAQIALFDTSDLAHVEQSDVKHYPGSEAIAAWDPRAFTWLPERDTVLTVLQQEGAVSLAVLTAKDGRLRSTLTEVEQGADSTQMRTLALPNDRIVLVTGEDVRFFDLP